jgi:FkbM family methyltransferase
MPRVDQAFTVPFGKYTYTGNLNNYIDWHVFYYGAYEQPELDMLGTLLHTDAVVFDVGANVGNHTLFFAQHAKHVYAFEPFPALATRLKNQLAHNAITHVTLMPYGLGAQNEERTFFAPQAHNQGMGSFTGQYASAHTEKSSLPLRNGDSVVRELNLPHLDLVKIDVEGMELEVLKGLQETIAKLRPILFVEFSAAQVSDTQDVRSILPDGYAWYTVRGYRSVYVFFNERGCRLQEAQHVTPGNMLFIPNESLSRLPPIF